MTWKTLGESLEAALASMLIDAGEGAIAVASDAVEMRKGADPVGPASVCQGDTALPAQEVHTSRRMTIASTNGLPRPAVVIRLVVDNGEGGRPAGGGDSRAAYRAAAGRERAREWEVIEGGRQLTASALCR